MNRELGQDGWSRKSQPGLLLKTTMVMKEEAHLTLHFDIKSGQSIFLLAKTSVALRSIKTQREVDFGEYQFGVKRGENIPVTPDK
jgi:hypothetical protein